MKAMINIIKAANQKNQNGCNETSFNLKYKIEMKCWHEEKTTESRVEDKLDDKIRWKMKKKHHKKKTDHTLGPSKDVAYIWGNAMQKSPENEK